MTVKKRNSIRRVAKKAILFGALVILFIATITEMVIAMTSTLKNDKREMYHTGRFVEDMIGKEYIEDLFTRTRQMYYSAPEEIRSDEFSDEYTGMCAALLDEKFHAAREILKSCRVNSDLVNIFFSFYDEGEPDRLVYVLDGNEAKQAFLPGQWISDDNGVLDSKAAIERTLRSSWYMPVTYSKVYGWTATDYVRVDDSQGNMIGYITICAPFDSFIRHIFVFLAIYIPAVIALLFVGAFITERWVAREFLDPINNLADAATRYAANAGIEEEGQVSAFKGLGLNTSNEIEDLWKTMVDMEDKMAAAMKQIKEAATNRERIRAELDLARNIQLAVLPGNFEEFSRNRNFEIFAAMLPAKEVGGDLYDFFEIDDDHVGLVIGDVSGKGVPAALIMMIIKTLIKLAVNQIGKPSMILQYINNTFCDEDLDDMFVTVWLGILNTKTGELVAANAGHEYPFVTDESGAFVMIHDNHGVVLGALSDMVYDDYSLTLSKGGKIFVYTDGVTECQNEKEELFGLERLEKSLNRNRELEPVALIEAVVNDLKSYEGETPQFDDITMLCLAYNGGEMED